ncbi:hypothetical protein ACN24M_19625 [Streptomyces microflavus]|uniref:hypothetical protein n=1 Tax=Streptomyces microflavus TaxID=1919 RepID=UPI003B2266D2
MADWKPLSVRRGVRAQDTLAEGIPARLEPALEYWAQGVFGYRDRTGTSEQLIIMTALAASSPIRTRGRAVEMMHELLATCQGNPDAYLDAIDYLLSTPRGGARAGELERALALGGSAWMVGSDGDALQRRVDATAQASFESARTPSDTASEELRVAWSKAFSREADPSDAWDHAIKAVEAILIPLVVPKQDKPQLGHVVGSLKSQSSRWKFILPGAALGHSVDPLVAMLDSLWPNPDRHATGTHREPTLKEAQAAVHLAVSLVQWARSGALELR